MPLLYASEGFAALLSIGFIILASIRLQYYGEDENRKTDNEEIMYDNSKWMLAFSIMFSLLSASFTLYISEFKKTYVDVIF